MSDIARLDPGVRLFNKFFTLFNFIPSYKGKKTPIKRLSTVTFKKLILYIFKKIKQIFLKAKYVYFSVKPFNIIFGGGRLSINAYRNHYPIGLTTKCYDIHSFDYDIFLRGLDSGCNNDSDDSDYIVFIDQYLPYHPDYTFLNKENLIEPVTYYKKMNVFFESVESKYNMPVVIAEHPRAFYDDKGDPYRGRRMVKNQTNYLIKNSSFVIMHASTAVVFGVLYKKPIVFVSGNSYPEKFNNAITSFAKALNKLPVNLDREPFDIDLSVDEASYQNYKRDYVKAGNNERFFWDQVIEQLSLMSS